MDDEGRERTATALTPLEVPGPANVVERLAEVARCLPDRVALDSWDGALTYAELDRRVRATAGELVRAVGDPEDRTPIALYAEQNTTSVAAFLAVIAAGHPCVVLDVLLPEARVAQIAAQAGVRVLVADRAHRPASVGLPGIETVLALEDLPVATGKPGPDDATLPELDPDDAAVLVFTSGSTGVPKGFVYTHRSAVTSADAGIRAMGLTGSDRVALVLPYAFAAADMILFPTLLQGATLVVLDPRVRGLDELVGLLRDGRITVTLCSPALMRAITAVLRPGELIPALRRFMTGGEKSYGRDVAAFLPHLGPEACYANGVGATEALAFASFEIRPSDRVPDGIVPLGWPYPHQTIEVLDDDGRPVPPGTIGLLAVTSAHHSGYYWGDPERTAARFEDLPDGRRRFQTGDKARLDEDGCLHLLGRSDDSVKIRGYLVEPGEVEAALLALPEVVDAVVRARATERGAERLVAWVVPDASGTIPSPAGLRAALSRALPDWMVPRDVVLMETMPRTERGKIDVTRLPPVPERGEPVTPITGTEAVLAGIWAPILHLDRVGRDESFTALGGDSLAVEEMLAAVAAQTGLSLRTADLAEHPTLADFAAALDRARTSPATPDRHGTLVRLRSTGTRTPVFCFAGAGAVGAVFEPLARALDDRPVYAFQMQGLENRGVPDWTVAAAARRYVRVLEEAVPTGPVLLVGHSLGGLYALKVAQLLNRRGRRVPLLTILDTYLPPAAKQPADGGHDGLPTPLGVLQARRQMQVGPSQAAGSRRELWQTRARLLAAGVRPYDPGTQGQVFFELGARVARFHRPEPWPGRTLLVVSEENDDDPRWWPRLFPGELTVEHVRTDHFGLLRPPFVQQLARVVESVAERASD
ncbi:amino acid adenylation domain-containing protein [Geodermatophilus normandii]|uniref:Amino acid adenylation domain-containing protein n=1 Tax=Geodermatophilus normandii TaxID=1137989 RepID=A0A317QGA2_9ACTN|nr:alpha/beta fold hydrolase [Geodermatophilus normandii]PWW21794.1 amino acid adenylation domain-containing protein [Geodermatophilus normandii]